MESKYKLLFLFIIIIIVVSIIIIYKYTFIHSVKEHKDYFSKTYNHKSAFYPYLSSNQGFLLEKFILKKLEDNYECICKDKKRQHFPKLIKVFKKKKIYITKCGISLDKLKKKLKKKYSKIDFKPQIECIIHNLKKNDIIHNDLRKKNLTIQNDGTLGLIDFEIADIINFCIKNLKNKRLYKSQRHNLYNDIVNTLKTSHYRLIY